MKRTRIDTIAQLPRDFEPLCRDARIFDSSSSPEARVYFIDKEDGFFLKRAAAGALAREAQMSAYFHSKGLSPEVLGYVCDGSDWLLTARACGEDCTDAAYLSDPRRLADTIAQKLRELHELDTSDCPVQDRMQSYFALAEENYRTGNYDTSHFPDSFGYRSPEEAYAVMRDGRDALSGRVLLHGDYCLPNIILDNWHFRAFIDLGNGGVGDRHVDLFWGAWTLSFNLHTDAWRERFLDAYGRDLIDEEKLRIVAAAEVFG